MSLLDLDERLLDLARLVDFDCSPLTDIKQIRPCQVGLVEGGVCNAENVHVLKRFREHCQVLVAVGACAITGGVPAMRNNYSLRDCLVEVYQKPPGLTDAGIPDDPALPLLLDKVHPIHEVVQVDHFLPGCPPSADAIWDFLQALLGGTRPEADPRQIRYD